MRLRHVVLGDRLPIEREMVHVADDADDLACVVLAARRIDDALAERVFTREELARQGLVDDQRLAARSSSALVKNRPFTSGIPIVAK